jgi:hypothetical protein
MVDTAELIRRITEFITAQPDDISKKELKKAIGDIYDELTKTVKKTKKSAKSSDSDGEEKKKRAPTKYNAFIKEQMAILKQTETPETKMNAKEKMLHISKLWQEAKKADDIKESDDAKKDETSDVDVEKSKGKTPRAGMGAKKGK